MHKDVSAKLRSKRGQSPFLRRRVGSQTEKGKRALTPLFLEGEAEEEVVVQQQRGKQIHQVTD